MTILLAPLLACSSWIAIHDEQQQQLEPSHPQSAAILGIDWDPKDSILRFARGGDNWPMTWGDDDHIYTAYGDGRGFRPHVERKLSTGLCRVRGMPAKISGENVRCPSLERTGGGAQGPKVSGLLMVDEVLYALVRNVSNSNLVWSTDHGKTWTWEDWKFTTSFGYPTFLNYGRNYAGAADNYVYIYSQDSHSAYERADRMVMARVSKNRLKLRDKYEFFTHVERERPVWSSKIDERGAVFELQGACYRSSVSYHPILKRYLWCQTGLGKDTRFEGGFAIYDAPNPWGPWTTVYETSKWDVGPGETSCIPTKWMNADGSEFYLVFSGDDCLSIRKGRFILPTSSRRGGER